MRKIIRVLVIFLSLKLGAQAPLNFIASFGGNGVDRGYGVKETYNRQYIVVGSTTSNGAGGSDANLILLDSMGNAVWQKTYGGLQNEVGTSIIIAPIDSGFIFTGFTNTDGDGGYDIYIVRTDKNGNLKWQTSYGGMNWDFGNDLSLSGDGNILVCGSTSSHGYGKKDAQLLKLDFNTGNLLWEKTFGGPEDDEFLALKKISDNSFVLAGNTKSYGDINSDFWFFKINDSGDSITSKQFGNSNKREKCYDFMEDNQNNLIFCGSYDTSFYNIGKNIAYVIKTDLNGNFVSEQKLDGAFTDDDKFLAIAHMKSGNQYFFSRKVNHVGPFGIDIQPYILNYNFIFIQTNTFGTFKVEEAFDVIGTKDNGFLMVGYTNGNDLMSDDIYVIKLDSAILNAQVLVGIEENPITPQTLIYYFEDWIYFQNPKREFLTFEIYDITGKIVQTLSTSENSFKVNSDLSNDIYFLRELTQNELKVKFIKNQ